MACLDNLNSKGTPVWTQKGAASTYLLYTKQNVAFLFIFLFYLSFYLFLQRNIAKLSIKASASLHSNGFRVLMLHTCRYSRSGNVSVDAMVLWSYIKSASVGDAYLYLVLLSFSVEISAVPQFSRLSNSFLLYLHEQVSVNLQSWL